MKLAYVMLICTNAAFFFCCLSYVYFLHALSKALSHLKKHDKMNMQKGMIVLMKHQMIGGTLYFYFYGDFDNLAVAKIKDTCIQLIDHFEPTAVKMDFEEVSFIDSTGIGFVLARYKQLKKLGSELILCNLSRANQTLFHMSGIFQIISYERSGVKL